MVQWKDAHFVVLNQIFCLKLQEKMELNLLSKENTDLDLDQSIL
jgi:hypothetical protein